MIILYMYLHCGYKKQQISYHIILLIIHVVWGILSFVVIVVSGLLMPIFPIQHSCLCDN